jgi:ribonuclease HII
MENIICDHYMGSFKVKTTFKKDYYEKSNWAEDRLICGVDEVGRGCIAGPIVTAAVILKQGKTSNLLKDSKILSVSQRLKSYDWIVQNSSSAIAIVDHRTIDRINIYQATLTAMKRCVAQLMATIDSSPSCIVVDAMPLIIPHFTGDVFYFNHGESRSSSIAAASIVAKVKRDALITRMAKDFIDYKLEQHKGYSTPLHKKRLSECGPSIIHRKTFIDHLSHAHESTTDLLLQTSITQELISTAGAFSHE